jgi:hypothetical protein
MCSAFSRGLNAIPQVYKRLFCATRNQD